MSNPASTPYIPEGRVAFWGGWGGSIVVNDVDRGLTFAYVMNRMSPGILGSPRSDAYLQALYGRSRLSGLPCRTPASASARRRPGVLGGVAVVNGSCASTWLLPPLQVHS